MLEWINLKFGTNLSEETLNEIKKFTLLWNIYDNIIFDSHFSIPQLEIVIETKNFDFNNFRTIYEYFQTRYVVVDQTNERFVNLNFRLNDREELVRNALINNNTANHIKVLAIGIIVYRLRNNLFHGVKDFHHLNGQIPNFINANEYLKVFIS